MDRLTTRFPAGIAVVLLASLAYARGLPAQTVQGTLVDNETGQRIGAATVTLLADGSEEAAGTRTDRDGVFVLRATRPGAYRLRADRPGYTTAVSTAIELAEGDTVHVQFRLSKRALVLEPLVVMPRRTGPLADYYERVRTRPWATIITREDIERSHADRATELLRRIPGIQVTPLRNSARATVALKGGKCDPTIFVDGIPIPPIETGRLATTIDDLVHPSKLEGIEVYRNPIDAPGKYGLVGCGAILLWTRREG